MAGLHSIRWMLGSRGAILIGVAAAAYAQPMRPLVVVGPSMSPTYHSGEVALTVPAEGRVRRGDVVVVDRPDGTIVKRVALVPGDLILQIRRGGVWREAFGMKYVPRPNDRRTRYVAVPEGVVYVVGDNLNASVDSRTFGPVPTGEITRKVYRPRLGRLREDFWAQVTPPECEPGNPNGPT